MLTIMIKLFSSFSMIGTKPCSIMQKGKKRANFENLTVYCNIVCMSYICTCGMQTECFVPTFLNSSFRYVKGIFISLQFVHKIYKVLTGGIVKNCIHPENNEKSYFFISFYIKNDDFTAENLPLFYPSA